MLRKASHRSTESQNHGNPVGFASAVLCFCVSAFVLASCATKAPPAVTGAPKHPEFIFPAAPQNTPENLAARLNRGWQYLQGDDYRSADREFAAVLKQQPQFYPAETAMAYLALARGNEKDAEARFQHALQGDATYVPALVGRGQALLRLDRNDDALASFEAALAKDPSLTDLRSRVDVLEVRAAQETLARAKSAAEARRFDEAIAAYRQAIAASPDSGFLYRELASVEQKAGQPSSALDHYRKAAELDPSDAQSLAGVAAILETQGDVVGALSTYERARALDPSAVPESIVNRLKGAAALAKLPAEYRAIPEHATINRADVAAMIGIRLEPLIARAKPRQVIITDIRGHWAQPWIQPVVRAGIMDTLPNYNFEPSRQVRRGDLVTTVQRVLSLIAALKPDVGKRWQDARVAVNDVSSTHLSYPAVSAAVASGVMPLSGGNFELLRGVSGTEAMEIISRLEALARP